MSVLTIPLSAHSKSALIEIVMQQSVKITDFIRQYCTELPEIYWDNTVESFLSALVRECSISQIRTVIDLMDGLSCRSSFRCCCAVKHLDITKNGHGLVYCIIERLIQITTNSTIADFRECLGRVSSTFDYPVYGRDRSRIMERTLAVVCINVQSPLLKEFNNETIYDICLEQQIMFNMDVFYNMHIVAKMFSYLVSSFGWTINDLEHILISVHRRWRYSRELDAEIKALLPIPPPSEEDEEDDYIECP